MTCRQGTRGSRDTATQLSPQPLLTWAQLHSRGSQCAEGQCPRDRRYRAGRTGSFPHPGLSEPHQRGHWDHSNFILPLSEQRKWLLNLHFCFVPYQLSILRANSNWEKILLEEGWLLKVPYGLDYPSVDWHKGHCIFLCGLLFQGKPVSYLNICKF